MTTRQDIANHFDQHAGALFGYLRHMGLAEADAYDVLQTTFLKLIESGPAQLQTPKAWLYAVGRRAAIDRLRRRVEAPLPDDEGPAAPDDGDALDSLLRDEQNAELWRAFSRLPAEDQELLRLHILDSMDYEELALVLQRSPGALRVALFRARARLRRELNVPSGDALESEALA